MTNSDCVAFLQWALPRMRMRWAGFRRVRRQVCRRLKRRVVELGLRDLAGYQRYLASHPEEWSTVDSACRIMISRFYRDHRVFERLGELVLPCLAAGAIDAGEPVLRCLSLGCASGEEPYTLAILWRVELASRYAALDLGIDAIDADERLLERAARGCYRASTLRELPEHWRHGSFEAHGPHWCIDDTTRRCVRFSPGDVRARLPGRQYRLVLCRNLVFTYYDEALQTEILSRIAQRLRPGGALVLGVHEAPPRGQRDFVPWPNAPCSYRRV